MGAPALSGDDGVTLDRYNTLCRDVLLPHSLKDGNPYTIDKDGIRVIAIELERALLKGSPNPVRVNLGDAIRSYLMAEGPKNQWVSNKIIQDSTCAPLLEAICAKQVLETACANIQYYKP